MLSLTRKMDYALVAMSDLARHAPARMSAREIAERVQVPLPMLTNILNQLRTYGLVTSSRGVQGGYRLAVRAEDISLAELIDAIEGPFKLTVCCAGETESHAVRCSIEENCGIREPVRKLHDRLRQFLGQVTLAHIVFEEVPIGLGAVVGSGAMLPVPED